MTGRAAGVLAAGALTVASCGGGGDVDAASSAAESRTAVEVRGTVTVLAAASLTGSFEQLGDRLEEAYPGLDVVFSFGPSSGLVEQVIAGAPADLLATADTRTMAAAVEGGVVEGEPVVFARNTLTLVVPAGNPGDVHGLDDLAREELRVALCEPQVPCGAATERLLETGGIQAEPDTLATDVKEATALVSLGEVDAAVVYVTDAVTEGDAVETIEVPQAAEVVNDYPVALVRGGPNPEAARLVVEAIIGDLGQGILAEAGFLGP